MHYLPVSMTQRTDVLGMEFETTLSGFGIRGEAAWYENESFLTSSLTSTANHTFSTMSFALIALSWGLIFYAVWFSPVMVEFSLRVWFHQGGCFTGTDGRERAHILFQDD